MPVSSLITRRSFDISRRISSLSAVKNNLLENFILAKGKVIFVLRIMRTLKINQLYFNLN